MSTGFLWIDIAGLSLTAEDRELLTHPAVAGCILFSRHFESMIQLQSLVKTILSIAPHLIIVVDQEGGRVQRFREGFTVLPSMQHWGEQYLKHPKKTRVALTNTLHIMTQELRRLGIYSSLVPVLDINYGRNSVIGERSFGDLHTVLAMGNIFIDALHAANMPATGKHFPGHGFVTIDSHLDLPIDDRDFQLILENDLMPFRLLAKKLDAIMPAHIVYAQCDTMPASLSSFWLKKILREQLQFDGLIVCDDLTMQGAAQLGSYVDRAQLALSAGCDVLLVCNHREGVIDIVDHVKSYERADRARRIQHYRRFL